MGYYDNTRYAISYYDYGISLLNKENNEFFENGKLTLDANYTLDMIIDKLMEEVLLPDGEPSGRNRMGLPVDLVSWWPDPETNDPVDAPIDFTPVVYRSFFSHFFNRQINQQTIDSHKLKLQQFFLGHQQSLIMKYRAYTQTQLKNTSKTERAQDGGLTTTTTTIGVNSSTPEDEVDIDLKTLEFGYADDRSASRQEVKNTNDGTDTTTNTNTADKDLEFALNLPGELESLYRDAEKHQLFMQSM